MLKRRRRATRQALKFLETHRFAELVLLRALGLSSDNYLSRVSKHVYRLVKSVLMDVHASPDIYPQLHIRRHMVEQFAEWRASILAVQEVPAEQTRRYGIVDGTVVNDRLMDINRIVEKPAPEDAPSLLGVAGRYILTPGVFHEIANQPRGVGGEIQLTDGIASLLRREKVFAYRYEGKRYDCGSKEGFLEANVELALAHPQLGPGFRHYLKSLEL